MPTDRSRSPGLLPIILMLLLVGCSNSASDQPWRDSEGEEISSDLIWSWQGDNSHCEWGSATFIQIGRVGPVRDIPDEFFDQFIRDPEGLFTEHFDIEFDSDADLPSDATFTGYSSGSRQLWVAPSVESAIYIKIDDRVERWPRVQDPSPIFCN